jgi:hypothetical protein
LGLAFCSSSVQAAPEDGLVAGWYAQHLGRNAYADELPFWTNQMRQGTSPDAVRAGIMASDEYYLRHGGSPEGFVAGLYADLLGRTANERETAYWLDRLPVSGCRQALAQEFIHDAARDLAQSAQPAQSAPPPAVPAFRPAIRAEPEQLRLPLRIER